MATVTVEEETTSRKGRAGKGLGWCSEELLALAKGVYIASTCPVKGSGMKSIVFATEIRKRFLEDTSRPEDACTAGRSGGPLDQRRWDGRSSDSCLKQWSKMKKECSAFHAAVKRVEALDLTGSPSENDLYRCAVGLYNLGGKVMSHLYDIIRNPDYVIGKAFPFPDVYRFLDSRTTMLVACGVDEAPVQDDGDKGGRPMGRKAAKKKKEQQQHAPEKTEADIAISMKNFEQKYGLSQDKKLAILKKQTDLDECRLEWDMMMKMFGPESTATTEERTRMERKMRGSLLQKLVRN